jgi:ABC-2 type transport system ATP-binding protein
MQRVLIHGRRGITQTPSTRVGSGIPDPFGVKVANQSVDALGVEPSALSTLTLDPTLPDGRELAVDARGLRRVFGARVAVDGVSLAVPKGSFFGVVGPNGAGKTTSLRMMTGLLKPDAGTVIVDGINVWNDPVSAKSRFGVLPDDLRLFERLTGREFLIYIALLRRIPRPVAQQRTKELLEVLGMGRSSEELVADYSQGMRKKIGLGAALLHVPAVLFLDEPFESVDPVSARALQEVLAQFRASGGTIIFSSHVMATVERLCDRVAIVHAGKVVRTGSTAEVCNGTSLEEAFISSVGAMEVRPDQLSWLRTGLAATSF